MAKKANYLFEDYYKSTDQFLSSNDTYFKFRDALANGENRNALLERFVDKNVDIIWIDKIEDSIIALDNIIRNPRNFIKEEEEIVPIALSRKITVESIRHLSQHTNMIQNVEGDQVTPSKILNVYKEESFATYENRFIRTLLLNLNLFVEKRYQGLHSQKDVNNVETARTENEFQIGEEKIKYAMEISISTPSTSKKKSVNEATIRSSNDVERVDRLRVIVGDFLKSDLIVKLKDTALVRPPIQKTNLLTKNQDYKKALELWQFIENYHEAGFNVNLVEDSVLPNGDYQEQLNRTAFFEYLLLKYYANAEANPDLEGEYKDSDASRGERFVDASTRSGGSAKRIRETNTTLLKKTFRSILGSFSDNLEEVKNIFVTELEKRNKNLEAQELKISQAIDRCLARKKKEDEKYIRERIKKEKERLKKEKIKQELAEKKRLEAEKKEQERLLKEEEKAKKNAERERLLQEKAQLREEKKRLQEEKKERDRLAKEEKLRLKNEQASLEQERKAALLEEEKTVKEAQAKEIEEVKEAQAKEIEEEPKIDDEEEPKLDDEEEPKIDDEEEVVEEDSLALKRAARKPRLKANKVNKNKMAMKYSSKDLRKPYSSVTSQALSASKKDNK